MTLIVIGLLFLVLFALAFLSKRRFGTLGLALAAGALLANHLTVWLAGQITDFDVQTGSLSPKLVANLLLTLLPAVILLMSGPSYVKRRHALFGALAFATMATLLLLPLLSGVLVRDELAQTVLSSIATYSDVVLTMMIVFAVGDAWLTHNLPSHHDKKHG